MIIYCMFALAAITSCFAISNFFVIIAYRDLVEEALKKGEPPDDDLINRSNEIILRVFYQAIFIIIVIILILIF